MTDEDKALQELEAEKQKQAVEEVATAKAEKIAAEKVEALKSTLIESIGGKKDEAPKSWGQLKTDIKTEALSEFEKRQAEKESQLRKEIDELKKERDEVKSRQQQTESDMRAEKSRIDREWKELVEDGELPSVKPEVMAKIEKNESLTDDDKNDEGLIAYNELIKTHFETNKGGSLYRTLKNSLHRQPSGSRAPVLGGRMRPSAPQSDDDYSYDEVHQEAIRNGLI